MKKLHYIFIFIPSIVFSNFDSLVKGISVNSENINRLSQESYEYAYASDSQLENGDGFAHSFLKVSEESDLFSLSQTSKLYLTNFETRELVGLWDLKSFTEHLFFASEAIASSDEVPNLSIQESFRLSAPEKLRFADDMYYNLVVHKEARLSKGCFQNSPMRYGDIDEDGNSEIVLHMGYDIVVFSPEKEKVIFSSHFWLQDELTEKEKLNSFNNVSGPTQPQFVAGSGTDVLINEIFPAWRSLTKLYSGEFNDEDGHDLILWRKVYDSNMNNEAPGFHKVADVLTLYTKADGEYVYVEAEQADIQNWLAENNLTWSKGYPSKSECPGEEGQLIPEMHDPLLNDPDVFQ